MKGSRPILPFSSYTRASLNASLVREAGAMAMCLMQNACDSHYPAVVLVDRLQNVTNGQWRCGLPPAWHLCTQHLQTARNDNSIRQDRPDEVHTFYFLPTFYPSCKGPDHVRRERWSIAPIGRDSGSSPLKPRKFREYSSQLSPADHPGGGKLALHHPDRHTLQTSIEICGIPAPAAQ